MPSSAAVNALVNPGSSGYRCWSRRTFGCLFGTLPLSRSWCATWFAVVLQCCFGLHGSSQSLRIVDHAFWLLWVMSVDSIRVCHVLRRSSEMALISSSPSVMDLSAMGLSSYFPWTGLGILRSVRWTRVSGLGRGSFYTHERCSFWRLFVGCSQTGHSIRLWRGCSPRVHRADMRKYCSQFAFFRLNRRRKGTVCAVHIVLTMIHAKR